MAIFFHIAQSTGGVDLLLCCACQINNPSNEQRQDYPNRKATINLGNYLISDEVSMYQKSQY